MTQITVSENERNEENLMYVQSASSEIFSTAGCTARIVKASGRILLKINCPEYYKDAVKSEIIDKVAEIVAIKYKYDFFKGCLHVGGLSSLEREILFTSLIAADLEDDKRYAFDKFKCNDEIAIDGTYNFRLKPLKNKWCEVADCVPQCFLNTQLKEFISYLLENKKKRVYIDDGRVYDWHYRRLKRSSLLDGESAKIVREVLLSNCGEVELSGQIPEEDEFYLREYYSDKIIFSNGKIN
ncbi:MAG: hypothetical protein E7347_01185 [Clostridiales bacterium]|nr:hypothetical protein [Clostridiales bacterium]